MMTETLSPEQGAQSLAMLLDTLRPSLGGQGHVAFYQEVATRLSTVVRQEPPWGWRYIQGVEKGTIKPSQKLARAVMTLGATLDGVSPQLADTEAIQVYARPGAIRPGSVILGESKTCARPGCTVSFVPRVPWQRYCSRECRAKYRQEGD